ncbi:MAG: hypothetical protein LBT16_10045 [Treponema sp.]|nr:hypothetical protein [Treponema sp.]
MQGFFYAASAAPEPQWGSEGSPNPRFAVPLLKGPGVLIFGLFFFIIPPALWSAGERPAPLDMFLIIDGSVALNNGKNEAFAWLCDTIIGDLLLDGDNLTIWLAGTRANRIFQGPLSGAGSKEGVKGIIRSIELSGTKADYAGALREAIKMDAREKRRRMTCTVLVSGSAPGYAAFPGNSETARLLRYSRIEEHGAWRAITAALNIGPEIQKKAAEFAD